MGHNKEVSKETEKYIDKWKYSILKFLGFQLMHCWEGNLDH